MKYYILYNPNAAIGKCDKKAKQLLSRYKNEGYLINMTEISNYDDFFSNLNYDDKVIICGGDGTLNHFVNDTENVEINHDIYYYPAGSGNDFYKDIGGADQDGFVKINEYLTDLPFVYVDDKKHFFINGIGYGVDGYCCKEVNRIRNLKKKANYALITLKGLLYAYKPTNATVKVEGKEYKYTKVWLASSMLGKYFGGGIKIAPMQDRKNRKNKISLIIAHSLGTFDIIRLFLSIFKGTHVKHKKFVAVHEGNDISVEFDRPTVMQIDGEVRENVTKYHVVTEKVNAFG